MKVDENPERLSDAEHDRRYLHWPFLIFGPLSTINNWPNKFRKWAPKIPVVVYQRSTAEKPESEGRDSVAFEGQANPRGLHVLRNLSQRQEIIFHVRVEVYGYPGDQISVPAQIFIICRIDGRYFRLPNLSSSRWAQPIYSIFCRVYGRGPLSRWAV